VSKFKYFDVCVRWKDGEGRPKSATRNNVMARDAQEVESMVIDELVRVDTAAELLAVTTCEVTPDWIKIVRTRPAPADIVEQEVTGPVQRDIEL